MNWKAAQLKHVTQFAYGDALLKDCEKIGNIPVYGSNGSYSKSTQANTESPVIIIGRKGSYGKVNWSDDVCFASDTTFFVDQTTTRHHLRWMFYVLQTLDLDKGSNEAAVPGLSREDAYQKLVYVPPVIDQKQISNYLDRETEKIDALIAAKKRLLKLLAEKRRSMITYAVTHGLKDDVPMKDSGVDWLGEVPAHWDIEYLKYNLSNIEQGWSPLSDNFPADVNEWGVLKVGAVNGWEFAPDENKRIPSDLSIPLEYEIKSGDILVSRANTTELVGSAALVKNVRSKLLLCDKLYRLILQGQRLLPEYLVFYLRSFPVRFEFERDSSGASSSMQNISQETLSNLWMAIPPVPEQQAIIEMIKTQLLFLKELEENSRKAIALLQERRTSLISAAVTGQICIAD